MKYSTTHGLLLGTALQTSLALTVVLPAHAQPAANARPTGGVVVGGVASISQAANNTAINQSSQRAAVNWQSFNVGSQQSVTFNQPSAQSVTLNRVVGSNPSQIAGRIDANGQVVLVNQSGVTFYKGAQVNTTGLMVSAIGMTNQSVQNFVNGGQLVLDQPGNPNAAVINNGNITVRQAGLAALVAPQVANRGTITAELGHVVLAGAKTATLDLYGDGLLSLDVNNQVTQAPVGKDGKPVTALVTNTGVIIADGGTVQLTARAADGIVQNLVQAGGKIRAATIGDETGAIALNGVGGSIIVEGQLSAVGNAPGTKGGAIEVVTNKDVTIASTAKINASGKAGGGTVAIGTTLARAKGGPSVTPTQTAKNVLVQAGAVLTANATANGNGGHITVLSTGKTQMDGRISANGGPNGGNGGFVETSGEGILDIGSTASVRAVAPHGTSGSWLLDPDSNIDITTSPPGGFTPITCTAGLCLPTADNSFIDPSTINNALDAGTSVTVTTSNPAGTQAGNITVGVTLGAGDGQIQLTAAKTVSLTLDAGAGGGAGSITINSQIDDIESGGALSVNLSAPNGGIIINNGINVAGNLIATAVTTTLNTDVSAGNGQTYNSAITLGNSVTLFTSGAAITLNGQVTGSGNSLTLTTLGGPATLHGVTTTGSGTLTMNTSPAGAVLPGIITLDTGTYSIGNDGALYNFPAVTTNGVLTIGLSTGFGAVTLGSDTTFDGSAANASVTFNSTIDGAHALVVNAGAGVATFDGTVGGGTPLTSLSVTSDPVLNANVTTAGGGQTYTGPTSLGASIILADTDGGAIALNGQVTGGANSLTLSTAGAETLSGITTTGDLTLGTPSSLTLDGGTYQITGSAPPYVFPAAPTTLNGTLALEQATTFDGAVTLGSATTVNVNGALDFASTLDGGFDLTINSFNAVTFGVVGGTTPLADLNVAVDSITLGGPITTTGSIGLATLASTLTINQPLTAGTNVFLQANNINLAANVTGGTGTGDTIELIASPGAITQTAGIITGGTLTGSAGTLSGPSTGQVSLLDNNAINSLGNFAVLTTAAAAPTLGFALVDDPPLVVTGAVSAPGQVYLASSDPGGITIAPTGTVTAGTLASFQTGLFVNNGSVSAGTIFELGPFAAGGALTIGGGGSSLGAITANTLRLGAVTPFGGSTPTTTAGSIAITGNFGSLTEAVDLNSSGPISETTGSVITAASVFSSNGVGGTVNLIGTANAIGSIGSFTVTGGDLNVVTASPNLTLAGAQSANNLFFEVAAPGGTLTFGSPAGFAPGVPATLTAGPNGRITLVADNYNVVDAKSITTNGGTVELASLSAEPVSLLGEGALSIGTDLLSVIQTTGGVLEVGGFTNVPLGATSPVVSASAVDIGGPLDVTGIANTLQLFANGPISQSGGALTVNNLAGSGTTWTLADSGNTVATLGNIAATTFDFTDSGDLAIDGVVTASIGGAISTPGLLTINGELAGGALGLSVNNLTVPGSIAAGTLVASVAGSFTETGAMTIGTYLGSTTGAMTLTGNNQIGTLSAVSAANFLLDDNSNLLISNAISAPNITILDPGNQITLGDGALLLTSGSTRPPGPLQPSLEPSNGAPGVYLQAGSFVQVGTSFVFNSSGSGPTTLQIATTGNMQFDPPAGLAGSGTWLILDLTSGTAAGSVFVDALDVIYSVPGAAALSGTIAGITGGPAAALGFIEPAINSNYLFNGCVIAAAACTLPTLTPTPTESTIELSNSDVTSTLGGLFPFLPGMPPPLVSLPRLVLVALPLLPAAAPQLTDPDVVPPNISYLDY